jgi:hypothetical protein
MRMAAWAATLRPVLLAQIGHRCHGVLFFEHRWWLQRAGDVTGAGKLPSVGATASSTSAARFAAGPPVTKFCALSLLSAQRLDRISSDPVEFTVVSRNCCSCLPGGPVHCTDEPAHRDVQDCPVGTGGPLPATTGGAPCSHQAPATGVRAAHAPPPGHRRTVRVCDTLGVHSSLFAALPPRAEATAVQQCAGTSPRRARPA